MLVIILVWGLRVIKMMFTSLHPCITWQLYVETLLEVSLYSYVTGPYCVYDPG